MNQKTGDSLDVDWLKEAPGSPFGKSLRGFGINIVVPDVAREVRFLREVLHLDVIRANDDFAAVVHAGHVFMVHRDGTYGENPFLSLLPESGPRGGGVELRPYEIDPDAAEARAIELGYTVLRTSMDRPHGLRECYIVDDFGYCWVPSVSAETT